jgi:hypothetical protein
MSEHVWTCLIKYLILSNHVWSTVGRNSTNFDKSVWSCLILSDQVFDHFWSCLIISDHVWSFLIMSIISDHVWSFLIMSDHFWSCLIMFDQLSAEILASLIKGFPRTRTRTTRTRLNRSVLTRVDGQLICFKLTTSLKRWIQQDQSKW